jgi:hypothetical protein
VLAKNVRHAKALPRLGDVQVIFWIFFRCFAYKLSYLFHCFLPSLLFNINSPPSTQFSYKSLGNFWAQVLCVATPLWAKWENATPTPKSGKMESSKTPENSEDDLRGKISSPWCVLYINGKLLKRRCSKWPRITHLNICSSSYGQKKGRESNWQFDSRPLKVGNRSLPNVASRSATWRWKALN